MRIAIDTETTGLEYRKRDRPFIVSAWNEETDNGWVVEFPVDPTTRRVIYSRNPKGVARVRSVMEDTNIVKVFHNGPFDIRMISAGLGIECKGRVEETTFKAHTWRSTEPNFGLKRLAKHWIGIGDEDEKELHSFTTKLRRRAKAKGWLIHEKVVADYWLTQYADILCPDSPPEITARMRTAARRYASIDAMRTLYLCVFLDDKLEKTETTATYERELSLMPVTMAMEDRGVYIDRQTCLSRRDDCRKILRESGAKIREIAGGEFNMNSYPQKIEYFVNKRGLEPLTLTPKGNPQINDDFLEHYKDEDELCGHIVRFSSAQKACKSYFNNILHNLTSAGTINATFRQVRAVTGRYSITDPALQTIPHRIDDPTNPLLMVKEVFTPRPNCLWYLFDYKQIEARVFADVANEETMLAAFAAARDVYQELADRINELTGLATTRQNAKALFLGTLYGMGRAKMARSLGTDLKHGTDIMDGFASTFPGVKEFTRETIGQVRADGFITNRHGRRIFVPKDFAYKGVNYKIQSDSADLMKAALLRVHKLLTRVRGAGLVMTIHDELIAEFAKFNAPRELILNVRKEIEDNQGVFNVATPVDVGAVRTRWTEKEAVSWAA